jgi:uncharacterized Zn finger protein (UPF0148 family)
MTTGASMRMASCPRCGKPQPAFDGRTVECQGCQQTTQLTTTSVLLEKANALWPDVEVTLRSKRVADLIDQHNEWLKKRGWYDIITATLDENWIDESDAVDGYHDDGDTAD